MPEIKHRTDGELEEKSHVAAPKMYKVLLLNDDFTSMEFVIYILTIVFHRTHNDAHTIMFKIHKEGSGLCGVYTYEIAETKVAQVLRLAKKNKFPLRAVMEEE